MPRSTGPVRLASFELEDPVRGELALAVFLRSRPEICPAGVGRSVRLVCAIYMHSLYARAHSGSDTCPAELKKNVKLLGAACLWHRYITITEEVEVGLLSLVKDCGTARELLYVHSSQKQDID